MSNNVIVLGMSNALAVKLNNYGRPEIIRDYSYDLCLTECVVFRTSDSAQYSVGRSARDDSYGDINRLIKYFADGSSEETEECLVSLLEYILEYSRDNGEDFSNAAICCPGYFDRSVIRNAAHKAGIGFGVASPEFISEQEAVLAYCRKELDMQHSNVLVCDLGGTRLDVYSLAMESAMTSIIGKAYRNRDLGGRQWTHVVKNLMIDKIIEETGLTVDELDDETIWELDDRADYIKTLLSFKDSVETRIRIYDEQYRLRISRKEFEKCAEKYVDIMRLEIENYTSKVDQDFDCIFLLGGSSKMPMIRNAIATAFPSKKIKYDNGYVLAYGAAYAANSRSTQDINIEED